MAVPSPIWRMINGGIPELGGCLVTCTEPPSSALGSRQLRLGIRQDPLLDRLPAAIFSWWSHHGTSTPARGPANPASTMSSPDSVLPQKGQLCVQGFAVSVVSLGFSLETAGRCGVAARASMSGRHEPPHSLPDRPDSGTVCSGQSGRVSIRGFRQSGSVEVSLEATQPCSAFSAYSRRLLCRPSAGSAQFPMPSVTGPDTWSGKPDLRSNQGAARHHRARRPGRPRRTRHRDGAGRSVARALSPRDRHVRGCAGARARGEPRPCGRSGASSGHPRGKTSGCARPSAIVRSAGTSCGRTSATRMRDAGRCRTGFDVGLLKRKVLHDAEDGLYKVADLLRLLDRYGHRVPRATLYR